MSENDGFRELTILATEMSRFKSTHPRAVKLFRKGKDFLVVSETEPYALDVYNMIRNQEKLQGTWDDEDEAAYQNFAECFTNGGE